MKKIFFTICIFTTSIAISQTFSDNFDSYTAGQYLCAQSSGAWEVTNSTSEDAYVSDAQSQSGSNAIYFSNATTNTGFMGDVLKHLGTLNTGSLSLQFNVFVTLGKDASFSVFNNESSPMTCLFREDGTLSVFNSGHRTMLIHTLVADSDPSIEVTYPQNQWINFRLDVNFNTNHWEVFLDNVSIGSFSVSSGNELEGIHFSALTAWFSDFFIDDFQYTVTPYPLPSLNAAIPYMSIEGAGVSGSNVSPKITVRNLGTTTINSFDLDVVYNGNTITQSVTGLSLPPLDDTIITLTATHTVITGQNLMVATVSNVNVTIDGDLSDDERTLTIETIAPAFGKVVVGEESTGTWCGWCVKGILYMDRMKTWYPQYWAGIVVHFDDPMADIEYADGMASLIDYLPNVLVDRDTTTPVDPQGIEAAFFNRLSVAPKSVITNGATWNATTRELNVSVSANFLTAATNDYKMAIVLTEDNVTGTTSDYNQRNYYSENFAGTMGGYEVLPDPILAANMIYNDVARTISPSFEGYNCFPAIVNPGETHTINTTFILPAAWDENEITIIGMLIAPDGTIDNAGKATIAHAVEHGFVSGTPFMASIDENNQIDATVNIYPNPASDYATIAINLQKESTVSMRILEISGKEVANRNYGSISGTATVTVNTTDLRSGVYIVEMTLDNTIVQRRLVIE